MVNDEFLVKDPDFVVMPRMHEFFFCGKLQIMNRLRLASNLPSMVKKFHSCIRGFFYFHSAGQRYPFPIRLFQYTPPIAPLYHCSI